MKRIMFDVSDDMFVKIDEVMDKEGFFTRAEFLRFLIVTYCKENRISSASETSAGNDSDDGLIDGHPPEDFEFGIPLDVIGKIKEKARKMTENERQQLS